MPATTSIANKLFSTVLPLVALALGCAGGQPAPVDPFAKNAAAQRPTHDEATIGRFEQNREQAEYEAALACWRREDVGGCQSRLQALLSRNAGHRDASQLMAQVSAATSGRREAEEGQAELVAHSTNVANQEAGEPMVDRGTTPASYVSSQPEGRR